MERKIGEIFEYEGKKLRVEADKDSECKRCCLNESCPDINQKIIGECVNIHRQDKTSVVFVEINNEHPQDLNLCEILKHCPKGEMFWSPLLGDVKLYGTDQETEKVVVTAVGNVNWSINADGTIPIESFTSPEIMLYPSREQRDWTKVKYEPKKEKFDPKTLKAFDKVLVNHDDIWKVDIFSHICQYEPNGWCQCTGDSYYICIPYNDDTKHLVGTKDEAPDFYKYWED